MKIIILAAGLGSRLMPHTINKPKCMVDLYGKPLLHHQLEVMEDLEIKKENIAVVGGYLHNKIDAPNIQQYINNKFADTNMVETLFCAEDFMSDEEDLIISYGDIIFEKSVLRKLLTTKGDDLVLSADLYWHKLWSLRMENPLNDVETFIMNKDGFVLELGQKPTSMNEVQAQYIGLIKVKAKKVKDLKLFYHSLDKTKKYENRSFEKMYMTSFIQLLINAGWKVKPSLIKNGWIELDTIEDLKLYNNKKLLNF